MKRSILIIILTIGITSSPTAQVNNHISDYAIDARESSGPESFRRPFVGEYEFETLPKPLKPTKVNFTLEVNQFPWPIPQEDWEVVVGYERKYMRLIGDSSFFWPAPHQTGDRFSGSFEFVPLISGYWEFGLCLPHSRDLWLPVGLCFDPDGNLTYLGNRSAN